MMHWAFRDVLLASNACLLCLLIAILYGVLVTCSNGSATQCFSYIPAAVLLASFGCEAYIFHDVCRPTLTLCVAFDVSLILAVWSFLRTALIDPGTQQSSLWIPPQVASAPKETHRAADKKRSGTWMDSEVAWCDKCELVRPRRAHHCKRCNTCVLRMDHHCPVLGNCIGVRNHKSFVLLHWWGFFCVRRVSSGPEQPLIYSKYCR
eukprot:TRINITY_DN73246_c0_g1_i1.p1 TRINITY_DN73246_c0_g1~~TRINITY_DN73246_c0_g1_i1.p1  ORF type:complete len:206 (-),score=9.77 TRINITY_DN73246_c0_g1_i1:531-1148(-)